MWISDTNCQWLTRDRIVFLPDLAAVTAADFSAFLIKVRRLFSPGKVVLPEKVAISPIIQSS